jgi:hypothetical protein
VSISDQRLLQSNAFRPHASHYHQQSGEIMQLVRLVLMLLTTFMLATPASAQFGGLKKRIKKATGQEDSKAAATAPDNPTPAAQGGTIVLTADVVNQLLTGLKAGQLERTAAAKEDTPYGRYKQAEIAYAEAQPKCEAGRQAWIQKGDSKQLDKANALIEKSLQAQQKQDYKTMQIYQDSVSLLQGGPSCVVKKPEQPKDYYEAERAIEVRAEKAEVKASGLSGGELAMVKERATMILGGSTPVDASASEKAAVSAKSRELKPLLGFKEQPKPETAKAEPAPAPAAAAAPAPDPQMSAAASRMSECMTKNVQTHQAEIEALARRAQAAQKANDQAKLMAIADTLQQIQMAGCQQR